MPWVIQIAGILFDNQRPVGHVSCMMEPATATAAGVIPNEKFWIDNKLTRADIEHCWFSTSIGIKIFHQYARIADRVVFHNARYDTPRISDTITRVGGELSMWNSKPKFCTMLSLEPVMKLPGKFPGKYKWPNLDEAYRAYVDPDGFEDAHDAMADVQACAKVLFAIEDKGIPLVQI
jgi:hypothetical protein